MYKKVTFLFFIVFLGILPVSAQFLHIGGKIFGSPDLEMQFFTYDNNEYVFYFANEQNETIRFDGITDSRIKSMKPYPAVYLRYDFNVRWFFQFETFYFWFTNEASYKNSVDLAEYSETFNTENNQEILNFNSIQLKWRFAGNRFFAGYTFMKTKSFRPFVFTGFSTMYLMDFRIGDAYKTREYRNQILFSHLSTFAPFTVFNTSGFGIQYHGARASFYWQRSVSDLDIYAADYKQNESLSIDEPHPNYEYMVGVFMSVSVNIFSINTQKSQLDDKALDFFIIKK